MIVYHRTDQSEHIIGEGFRDGSGRYMFDIRLTGVFVSDVPLDGNEGAKGSDLLAVDIDEGLLGPFELVDEESVANYREWCVPAEVLNTHGKVVLLSGPELDAAETVRWTR